MKSVLDHRSPFFLDTRVFVMLLNFVNSTDFRSHKSNLTRRSKYLHNVSRDIFRICRFPRPTTKEDEDRRESPPCPALSIDLAS